MTGAVNICDSTRGTPGCFTSKSSPVLPLLLVSPSAAHSHHHLCGQHAVGHGFGPVSGGHDIIGTVQVWAVDRARMTGHERKVMVIGDVYVDVDWKRHYLFFFFSIVDLLL